MDQKPPRDRSRRRRGRADHRRQDRRRDTAGCAVRRGEGHAGSRRSPHADDGAVQHRRSGTRAEGDGDPPRPGVRQSRIVVGAMARTGLESGPPRDARLHCRQLRRAHEDRRTRIPRQLARVCRGLVLQQGRRECCRFLDGPREELRRRRAAAHRSRRRDSGVRRGASADAGEWNVERLAPLTALLLLAALDIADDPAGDGADRGAGPAAAAGDRGDARSRCGADRGTRHRSLLLRRHRGAGDDARRRRDGRDPCQSFHGWLLT